MYNNFLKISKTKKETFGLMYGCNKRRKASSGLFPADSNDEEDGSETRALEHRTRRRDSTVDSDNLLPFRQMYIPPQLVCMSAVLLATLSDSARILAVLPYNARSHWVVMAPLLHALHDRGHHLTVVSSFPQKKTLENYRDIDLSKELPVSISNYSLQSIKEKMPNIFKAESFIIEINLDACQVMFNNPEALALLNEKFDLVITEIFGSDCANYFAYKIKAPLVSWVTSTALPWMTGRTGFPDNPSYIPNYFLDFSADMSLPQRLYNLAILAYTKVAYHYYSEIPTRRMAEESFRETLPAMDEVNRLTSLVFVNSHFSLAQSRPFPPNVVEVGGIHIKEPQPLPKDLKDVLDNSKAGVILFSLGSLVRAATLPRSTINMFLEVFASLPQQVIFKFEEDLPEAPPNVLIRKWLPQTDIVAHPKVRAVITHGGLASTIEAVHFAKPMVGVPFFSDQFLNVNNIVRHGGGIMLDIDNLSAKQIKQALAAVLEDPRYAENMHRLSTRFRDRPLNALQSAVYWTEYVIRHQGAAHLQPASVHLPLHQYLLLDVLAVLLLAVTAGLLTVYFTVRWAWSLVCGGKRTGGVTKRNKKTD